MELSKHIAKQLRAVYNGGAWSGPDLKKHLADVTWEEATTPVYGLNTIATLVFHMNYYVAGVIEYLRGNPLDISDKFSFEHPPINNEEDWTHLVAKVFQDCEELALEIERVPIEKMEEIFFEERYGSYYRNFTGIIEHFHYHLGQIVFIKKILQQQKINN